MRKYQKKIEYQKIILENLGREACFSFRTLFQCQLSVFDIRHFIYRLTVTPCHSFDSMVGARGGLFRSK
jgi:hypothetical protein